MLDDVALKAISDLTGLKILVKDKAVGFSGYHRINHGMKLGIALGAICGYDWSMVLANTAIIGTQDMEQIIFWRVP